MNNYKFVENNMEDITDNICRFSNEKLNNALWSIEKANENDILIFYYDEYKVCFFSYLLEEHYIDILKPKIRKLKIKRILKLKEINE